MVLSLLVLTRLSQSTSPALLKCVLYNARSVVNKVDWLSLDVDVEKYDIVSITETWLDPTIPDSLVLPADKYNCYRKDRNRSGGGICMFVKNHILAVVPSL